MKSIVSPYAYPGICTRDKATVDLITEIVCDFYKMPNSTPFQKTRYQEVVKVRKVCWVMIRRFLSEDYSLKRTARVYGSYDHTTVIHGISALLGNAESDEKLDKEIESIARRIKAKTHYSLPASQYLR